ncbi:MAG: helix-turn-helix transcriptional regulator [Rubrobacteraceae bacterium]
MGVGGAVEDRTFSEVKRLCHSALDGPELLGAVVDRLRRAIPFDAHCGSTVDPASGFITHAIAEEMGGAREAVLFLEHLYFEHDREQIEEMVRSRRSVALLEDLAGGSLDDSPRYRELLRPLGLAHEMRVVFTAGGSSWGGVDLIRGAGGRNFTPRETSLLERLAPHIGAGLKTAALRAKASDGETSDGEASALETPGVLSLDHRSRVVFHTPAAEYWLGELENLGPRWREGDGLPAAVRSVCGALRRTLGPEAGGVPRLRARTRSGRWIALYGSLTEARPSETVIVIEPARPEEVALFNMASYELSRREEEVARLLARGSSTKEISAKLFISEYTVQNHLRNVFEKVGVKSRGELLKRLFFDNVFPSMFG